MLKKLLLLSTLFCASLMQAKEFKFENNTNYCIKIKVSKEPNGQELYRRLRWVTFDLAANSCQCINIDTDSIMIQAKVDFPEITRSYRPGTVITKGEKITFVNGSKYIETLPPIALFNSFH